MAGCTHTGPLAAWQDADRVPAGPRAVGVGLRPRRHRPRGLAGCSPRCRRETARSAMVGPAKCMVKLRCAWSRWRASAMRQGHEAPEVSPFHSRSLLAPAHLRSCTSSRVSFTPGSFAITPRPVQGASRSPRSNPLKTVGNCRPS